MEKTQLLDVVQEVLSDMDSDQVNSIDDTFESEQVVSICRSVYRDMVSNRNWPFFKRAIQLTPYTDNTKPTHMRLRDNVKELIFLNYNTSEDQSKLEYREMVWLDPDDFLRRANFSGSSSSNSMLVTDPSGIQIFIRKDAAPTYYTSFNDSDIVFDSFDQSVENTLQASKTQALGYVMPTFTAADDWVIDLPREAISAYIAEVKSQCFAAIKQQVNEKMEQVSRRQQSWLSRKDWRVNGGVKYPNYGRRSRKGDRSVPFDKRSYVNKVKP